jgi:hypothetical protein
MKNRYFICLLCLFASSAFAEAYRYVHAEYSYSTLGGVTTLNVDLHNNGAKNATCEVTVFNREQSAYVAAYGRARVSFSSLPEGAQARYGCTAN